MYNIYITNQFQTTFARGGVRSVSRGDCEQPGGKFLRLLSQLPPRIRPLVSIQVTIHLYPALLQDVTSENIAQLFAFMLCICTASIDILPRRYYSISICVKPCNMYGEHGNRHGCLQKCNIYHSFIIQFLLNMEKYNFLYLSLQGRSTQSIRVLYRTIKIRKREGAPMSNIYLLLVTRA